MVLVMATAAGCTCATSEMRDAPPSPDVLDPLEPCALGIRRAAMDLPAGGDRVAMLGDGERLWVADAVGPGYATARLTALALDGTRLASYEAELPYDMINPQPVLVMAGDPPQVVYASGTDRRATVTFGASPGVAEARFVERVVAADERGLFALRATPPVLTRFAFDGTSSSLDLTAVGIGGLARVLSVAGTAGRGYAAGSLEDGRTLVVAYDFSSSTPSADSVAVDVAARSPSRGGGVLTLARTSDGVVMVTASWVPGAAGSTLHVVWLDESLSIVARHDHALDGYAAPLGVVSGPHGELVVIEVATDTGPRQMRVVVADRDGGIRGGDRALVVVGGSIADTRDADHVWSPIPGAVSVAIDGEDRVEVLTFCAPL